jgi:hypothetical protein
MHVTDRNLFGNIMEQNLVSYKKDTWQNSEEKKIQQEEGKNLPVRSIIAY